MEKGTRASSSSRSPSRCHVAMGAPEGVGVSNIPPQVRRGTHGRVCQASGWVGSRLAPLIWWHGVIERQANQRPHGPTLYASRAEQRSQRPLAGGPVKAGTGGLDDLDRAGLAPTRRVEPSSIKIVQTPSPG